MVSFRKSGVTCNGVFAFRQSISRYSRLYCFSSQYVKSVGVLCAEKVSEYTWHHGHRQMPLSTSQRVDLLCLVKIWWAFRYSVFQHTSHDHLIRTTLDQRSSAFFGSALDSRFILALSFRTDSLNFCFSLRSCSFGVSFISLFRYITVIDSFLVEYHDYFLTQYRSFSIVLVWELSQFVSYVFWMCSTVYVY